MLRRKERMMHSEKRRIYTTFPVLAGNWKRGFSDRGKKGMGEGE